MYFSKLNTILRFYENTQQQGLKHCLSCSINIPDSKVHGVNMGPTWVLSTPCWPHKPCYQGCLFVVTCWQLLQYSEHTCAGCGSLDNRLHSNDIWVMAVGTETLWCQIEGILPKEHYLSCLSMAGRALLIGYHGNPLGLYIVSKLLIQWWWGNI